MARFYLHVVGEDRAGIVAGVTAALDELGCNLEDSRMYLLQGQFSIGLVVDAPRTWDGSIIEAALAPVSDALALATFVRPMPEHLPTRPDGSELRVSIDGADRPGMVARLSREIARHGASIEDLAGHRLEQEGGAIEYRMTVTCILPPGDDGAALAEAVARAAEELGVHCHTSIHRSASSPLGS